MTGVTCEAGNAQSSGAPDFTLQWRVHVVFTDSANDRTSILLVNDFGFVCFGMRLQCCLYLDWYGLILMLTNVYWD